MRPHAQAVRGGVRTRDLPRQPRVAGLARESALKLLELTDGRRVAAFDTPLGFRHGPKTLVNSRTLGVVFVSNDRYTRQYDIELLAELGRDGVAAKVVAVTAQPLPAITGSKPSTYRTWPARKTST